MDAQQSIHLHPVQLHAGGPAQGHVLLAYIMSYSFIHSLGCLGWSEGITLFMIFKNNFTQAMDLGQISS